MQFLCGLRPIIPTLPLASATASIRRLLPPPPKNQQKARKQSAEQGKAGPQKGPLHFSTRAFRHGCLRTQGGASVAPGKGGLVGQGLANNEPARQGEPGKKKHCTLLDLCVSSLRRGHANLLCIVPILSDDLRRVSKQEGSARQGHAASNATEALGASARGPADDPTCSRCSVAGLSLRKGQ